ncbi:hypothetical protein E4T56_gene16365 [Termitomyces sp. T112]|nr:hypothetical protein E4T56_gene16365 [Termitomyces sp. T112]
MVFCLNPAKHAPFPRNPTSPDLPGPIWITSHQLSAQAISAQNALECPVASARGSRLPSKDSPSAAEPPGPPGFFPSHSASPELSLNTSSTHPNLCLLMVPTPANSNAFPANSDDLLANSSTFSAGPISSPLPSMWP